MSDTFNDFMAEQQLEAKLKAKDAEIAALRDELEKQKAAYAALWKDRDEQEHTRAEYFREIAALREALNNLISEVESHYETEADDAGCVRDAIEQAERVLAEGQK